MVKIVGALYTNSARGWLGRYQYARLKVVSNPYPIGLHWKYPYHAYYYSPRGWCYQMRRTWHGIVQSAIKPPVGPNPQTALQQSWRQQFADAITSWQGMDQATKDVYNKWKYPVHASGYNRFLRWYLMHTPYTPPVAQYILLETGDKMLTEAGEFLIQE